MVIFTCSISNPPKTLTALLLDDNENELEQTARRLGISSALEKYDDSLENIKEMLRNYGNATRLLVVTDWMLEANTTAADLFEGVEASYFCVIVRSEAYEWAIAKGRIGDALHAWVKRSDERAIGLLKDVLKEMQTGSLCSLDSLRTRLKFNYEKIMSLANAIHELYIRTLAFRLNQLKLSATVSKTKLSDYPEISKPRSSHSFPEEELAFGDFVNTIITEGLPDSRHSLKDIVSTICSGGNPCWFDSSGSSKNATKQLEELAEILKKEDAGACKELNAWIDRFDKYLRELRIELQK